MRLYSLARFYGEKHKRTLDRYWDYDEMRRMAKTLKKRMPKKPIYVLFEAASEEEADCFQRKLMELEAIEIESFPQATYVLGKEREETVRSLFDGFQGTVVIGDSGGLPAFLFYGRYNWTRLKFIFKKLQTEAGFEIKRIEGVGGSVFLLNSNESWPRTFMGRFLWDFLHW